MPIYHQIKSLVDEQRLLKEIIDLETQIRMQREWARRLSNSQNEKHTKNFEPITRSIKTLAELTTTRTMHSAVPNNLIKFTEASFNLLDDGHVVENLPQLLLPTKNEDDAEK